MEKNRQGVDVTVSLIHFSHRRAKAGIPAVSCAIPFLRLRSGKGRCAKRNSRTDVLFLGDFNDNRDHHIAQAKTILTDLAESIETVGSDENPDDEVEDTGEASDEIDAMLNTLDELESSLDDLREAIQG